MRRGLFLAAAGLMALAGPAAAEGTGFAAIAFHDVVDTRAERTDDAVTTQSLVDFFDWLKADGWTPVSLAQVEAAGKGGPPLPDKAILLGFDDGYRSFHDRVYPLLLAYRYPAVLALVGSWMDVPAGGTVDYGGRPVSRERFLTWDQVRAIQASGLVEIASHSNDLHRVVPSTPQGNTGPAARSWRWIAAEGRYETDAEHRARIEADLRQSRTRIAAETGKAPRALVWPFGRHSGLAVEAARAAGFEFAFTLEPERADARQPMALHRYYPTWDPSLGILAWNLGFPAPKSETVRLACVDLKPMAALTGAAQDEWLGGLIESVRRLGATDIVLDLGRVADGAVTRAWLPGTALAVEADIFGRAARQLGVRAGVSVHARIPAGPDAAVLAAAAARAAPIDGLLFDPGTGGAPPPAQGQTRTDIRAARQSAPLGAVGEAFAAAAAIDPRLRLMVTAPTAGPGPGTDRQLVSLDAPGAQAWLVPAHSGRLVVPAGTDPAAQQRQGATALSVCPWDGKPLKGFSAATFPWLP